MTFTTSSPRTTFSELPLSQLTIIDPMSSTPTTVPFVPIGGA